MASICLGLNVLMFGTDKATSHYPFKGFILGMHSANERQRYNVTWSLIDYAYIQNDPCI